MREPNAHPRTDVRLFGGGLELLPRRPDPRDRFSPCYVAVIAMLRVLLGR